VSQDVKQRSPPLLLLLLLPLLLPLRVRAARRLACRYRSSTSRRSESRPSAERFVLSCAAAAGACAGDGARVRRSEPSSGRSRRDEGGATLEPWERGWAFGCAGRARACVEAAGPTKGNGAIEHTVMHAHTAPHRCNHARTRRVAARECGRQTACYNEPVSTQPALPFRRRQRPALTRVNGSGCSAGSRATRLPRRCSSHECRSARCSASGACCCRCPDRCRRSCGCRRRSVRRHAAVGDVVHGEALHLQRTDRQRMDRSDGLATRRWSDCRGGLRTHHSPLTALPGLPHAAHCAARAANTPLTALPGLPTRRSLRCPGGQHAAHCAARAANTPLIALPGLPTRPSLPTRYAPPSSRS